MSQHGRPRRSVLTVTSTPHERPSTGVLKVIVAELGRRPDIDAHLWFLREGHRGDDGRDFPAQDHPPFVVDSLRTWWPAAAARALGLEPVAGKLRGWRLRRLLRDAHPGLVLLDDGFGERILSGSEAGAVRVVRINDDEPMTAAMEAPFDGRADVWLVPPGVPAPAGSGRSIVVSPLLDDYSVARRHGAPEEQRAMRADLGIPPDEQVVVGWGSGGWIDGPDLFLRGLWALRARHGVAATGLWIGQEVNDQDRARLEAEAVRCGLEGRFHLVERPDAYQRCGDVAFLPYRCHGERSVLDAVASGLAVVGFEALGVAEEAVTLVPDLDVDAAAAALASAPVADRSGRVRSARERLDVAALVDRLVELASVAGRP